MQHYSKKGTPKGMTAPNYLEQLGLSVFTAETTCNNSRLLIHQRTQELLGSLCTRHSLYKENVLAAIFLAGSGLTAAFPAEGARHMGWVDVPLLCMQDPSLAACMLRVVLLCDKKPVQSFLFAVRGASSIEPEENPIDTAVHLLREVVLQNKRVIKGISGVISTVTPEIPVQALFPIASRWEQRAVQPEFFSVNSQLDALVYPTENVQFFYGNELNVTGAPSKMIRVLLIGERFSVNEKVKPVYLKEAIKLRPDLFEKK